MTKRIVIYDIEVFPNFFVVVFFDVQTLEFHIFEISQRRDDRHSLYRFLTELGLMIGFNNLEFDYPVLNVFIVLYNQNPNIFGKDLVRQMKIKVNQIINSRKRFGNAVRNPAVPQLDLYKMHHFDNIAKSTSLKALEFVLRMREIQELPFPPETVLTPNQMDIVIDYCKNKDVRTTHVLYEKSSKETALRKRLSEIYNIDMTNLNDPKIGEQILLSEIKKITGVEKYFGTPRNKIVVKDILFDYLAFYTPEFKAIYNWFSNKILTTTKEVFSKIPIEEVESLKPYVNLDRNAAGKRMTMKKGTILKTLNVVYEGFQYDFGVGGIHGSIKPGVYFDTDEMAILDVDVKSYYPNLAIKNRFYPEHLGEQFCDIYEGIYIERGKYPKKSPENEGLKLGLNGSYGKSNSEYSELYDPKYTMTTTINGQLSLCMLAEMLSIIPKVTMLQINTDGLTIMLPKDYLMVAKNICEKWEKITKLTLEYVRYNKMIIRDVNNYLAVYRGPRGQNAGVKRKGAFEYERELHQNHSMMIVPRALEAYYVHNKDISEFMVSHNDMWDFFKRVKLTGNSKLFIREGDKNYELQKLTRYYVSNNGGLFIKTMPPLPNKFEDREFNIEAGYLCTPANKVDDFVLNRMREDINYDYYVQEAYKIVNAISHGEILEVEEEN